MIIHLAICSVDCNLIVESQNKNFCSQTGVFNASTTDSEVIFLSICDIAQIDLPCLTERRAILKTEVLPIEETTIYDVANLYTLKLMECNSLFLLQTYHIE